MTIPMERAAIRGETRAVGRWLVAFAAMIVAIILVGGATRLTESGLSITEWKPVSGVIPPMSDAAWRVEFEKYQRIPQYQQLNQGMSLESFKRIYLWEYGHRVIARVVGLFFALPLAWFALRRRIPPRARAPLVWLLVLMGVQGAMGWWMVSSGLSARTEVSQYRLALHLTTALVILALATWTAAGMLEDRGARVVAGARRRACALGALLALVGVTAASGALVAGLRAGKIFNTFPLMGDGLVPPGYGQLTPGWLNIFENHAAVQFNHRVLAVTTAVAVVLLWAAFQGSGDRRFATRLHIMLGVVIAQLALGIATLLLSVPIWLGVAHQGGAVALMLAVLLALHATVEARGPAASTLRGRA